MSMETMRKLKNDLATHFKMKNLGKLHFCLGITIEYDEECSWMHQRNYIQSLLEKYGMSQAKPSSTPAKMIANNSKEST